MNVDKRKERSGGLHRSRQPRMCGPLRDHDPISSVKVLATPNYMY